MAPSSNGCEPGQFNLVFDVKADGWFTADVGNLDALAIHVGAKQ